MAIKVDTTPGGTDVITCPCGEEWYPLFQRMALKRGLVKKRVDPMQGGYRNSSTKASADTHNGGGAFDFESLPGVVQLAREMGADAWLRVPPAFEYHIHLILHACPHLSRGAFNQTVDYVADRNGLANNGPDNGPRVRPIRTWKQGVQWAQNQLKETDMPLSDADIAKLVPIIKNCVRDVMNDKFTDLTSVSGTMPEGGWPKASPAFQLGQANRQGTFANHKIDALSEDIIPKLDQILSTINRML